LKRQPLKSGTTIELTNGSGKRFSYLIKSVVKNGDKGQSCLCYKVIRLDDNETVLLKELYPVKNEQSDTDVERNNSSHFLGHELMQDGLWDKCKSKFERGIEYLHLFKNDEKSESYICAEKEVEPLYGYGTVYCENTFIRSAVSWEEDIRDNPIKIDEILLTALGVHQFLRQCHEKNLAYVDLKASDILLPKSKIGNLDNDRPLFYDFNSMLKMGDYTVASGEVDGTKEYMPRSFKRGLADDTVLRVGLGSEQYTYGAVVKSIIEHKWDSLSFALQDKMNRFFGNLMDEKGKNMSEEEIENTLKELRIEVQDNEYEQEYEKLPKRTRWFHLLHFLIVLVAVGLHIATGVVITSLCINRQMTEHVLFEKYNMKVWHLLIILLLDVLLLNGLKLLSMYLAQRIANITISCKYYKTNIRNGRYNSFRLGKRKNTTFQDTHKGNSFRQWLRRKLWAILFITLVVILIFSVFYGKFSVFISAGCLAVLVFMYADCVPSTAKFFSNYAKLLNIPGLDVKDERAAYYYEEAENTQDSFDLNHEYYKTNHRNLFTIRQEVCNEFYEDAEYCPKGLLSRIRWYFSHRYRYNRVDGFKKKNESERQLGFPSLEIRHIYKMRFDRMRNFQLILSIVVAIGTLTVLFLSAGYYSDFLKDYFYITEPYYLLITLGLLAASTVINCYQIIVSLRDELFIADMSYKSKYVVDEPKEILNDLLVRDIAAGLMKPIDLARGIWQYTGYMFTEDDPEFIKAHKLQEEDMDSSHKMHGHVESISCLNRQMLHHSYIGAQSRVAITVWLLCAILFSVLVWEMRICWLFPVLVIGSAVVHLLTIFKWLPMLRVKRIRKIVSEFRNKLEKMQF
jgi:uncharacterized membrane protein